MTKREARIRALKLVSDNTWGCLAAWDELPEGVSEEDWINKVVPAMREIAHSLSDRASKLEQRSIR